MILDFNWQDIGQTGPPYNMELDFKGIEYDGSIGAAVLITDKSMYDYVMPMNEFQCDIITNDIYTIMSKLLMQPQFHASIVGSPVYRIKKIRTAPVAFSGDENYYATIPAID